MLATVLQFRNAEWQEAETCCACGVEFTSPVIRTFKQLAQHMKCKHAGINSVNSGEES